MTIRGLGRVHGLRSGGPLLATPVGDAAINWFIYPIYSLLLSKRKLRSQRQKGKPNRQRKFLQNHHDPKSEYNTMRRLLVFTYETIRVSSASETFTCLSLSSLQHPGHRKACLFGLVRLSLCHTVCFFLYVHNLHYFKVDGTRGVVEMMEPLASWQHWKSQHSSTVHTRQWKESLLSVIAWLLLSFYEITARSSATIRLSILHVQRAVHTEYNSGVRRMLPA